MGYWHFRAFAAMTWGRVVGPAARVSWTVTSLICRAAYTLPAQGEGSSWVRFEERVAISGGTWISPKGLKDQYEIP